MDDMSNSSFMIVQSIEYLINLFMVIGVIICGIVLYVKHKKQGLIFFIIAFILELLYLIYTAVYPSLVSRYYFSSSDGRILLPFINSQIHFVKEVAFIILFLIGLFKIVNTKNE